MTRKNAQARRVEVLGETLRVIREKGMSALRISDVAEVMDVSPALIIYHFETKEKLLSEALTHAAERDLLKLGRIMRQPGTAPQRLMAALEWYAPTGQARGWKIWVDAWSASLRDAAMAKVLGELQAQWTAAISGLIEEGVQGGVFTSTDPHGAATRLTSFLDGLAVRSLVHHERISSWELHNWLLRQVAWELGIQLHELEPQEAVGANP